MLGYIFGFTIFASLVGSLFELFNGRDKKPIAVFVTTFIVMGMARAAIIYFLLPPFSHWLAGGYPLLFFVNLFIPALISLAFGYREYGDWAANGAGIGMLIGVVLLIIYSVFAIFTAPAWCNTRQIRQRIGLLELQAAKSPYPNTDLDNIIRVPASVALSKAGNALSSGENAAIGSYLQPNRAYIQLVQGRPFYVIDLRVTSWVGFRQAGAVIPGYLLVDANDENAPVEFRLGYKIRYAPYARWNLDLDRYVYTSFLLGTPYRIQDLDGMEVDDDFNPTYTGTVMRHSLGFQGLNVAGLYQVDPQNGVGVTIRKNEIPEWIDRVYPLEWVKTQVDLWGKFANHDACSRSQLGQVQLDWVNDVTIPEGLEYQITLTSMGEDPSLTQIITVNPTTGLGIVYPAQGKTIQGIKAMVEQRSKLLNPAGYVADECEIHRILNSNTVYCILTFQNGSDYSIGGYAFVDVELAMNNNLEDVAVAATFDEAYFQYQEVKSRVSEGTDLAATQSDIQVTGTVLSNNWVNYGGEAGSYLLNVKVNDK